MTYRMMLFFMLAAVLPLSPCLAGELCVRPLEAFASHPVIREEHPEFLLDANAFFWRLDAEAGRGLPTLRFEDPLKAGAPSTESHPIRSQANVYALMIDDSLSMRPFWDNAREAMQRLLDLIPPSESTGLYRFSEDLVLVQEPVPVPDIPDGKSRIAAITLAGKDTQLYLALLKVMDALKGSPAFNRHILLFSDGDAEDRARTLEEVLRRAGEQDVRIHSIGFGRAGRSGTALNMEVLRTLSQGTGGLCHFFENPETMEALFRRELARHSLVGLVRPGNLESLVYGQESLRLVARMETEDGEIQTFEKTVPVTGTRTFGNMRAALLYHTAAMPFWQILLLGSFAFLLFFAILPGIPLGLWYWRKRRLRAQMNGGKGMEGNAVWQEATSARLAFLKSEMDRIARKMDAGGQDPGGAGKALAFLVEDGGRVHGIFGATVTLGRSEENGVVLDDAAVSREHAVLQFKQGRFVWMESSPRNPTRINGEEVVVSREIWPEDRILCGTTELRFTLEAE